MIELQAKLCLETTTMLIGMLTSNYIAPLPRSFIALCTVLRLTSSSSAAFLYPIELKPRLDAIPEAAVHLEHAHVAHACNGVQKVFWNHGCSSRSKTPLAFLPPFR